MMYKWTPDIIRFIDDASKYSNYFEVLAKTIFEKLGNAQNVCDAGCGLGQLAIELSKYYPQISGIDINKNATDFFLNRVKETGIENVKVINADVTNYKPDQKYDLMVFNYFGDINQILESSSEYCCGKTVIIKRAYKSHRFSFEDKPITTFNRQSAVDVLREKNIPYQELGFSHEFGQPFKSIDDAVLFFETFSHDTNRSLINRENVLKKLVKTEDKNFPYYMQHIKESCILII